MSFMVGGKVVMMEPVMGMDPEVIYTITDVITRRGDMYLRVHPGHLETWFLASRFQSYVAPATKIPLKKVRPELFVMTFGNQQRHLPMWVLKGFLSPTPSVLAAIECPEAAQ